MPPISSPNRKRIFLGSLGLVVVGLITVYCAASSHVEGVWVSGKMHDVSASDIQEAVAAAKYAMSDKPAELEVIGNGEMHAYLPSRDLGWIPVRRTTIVETDGHQHPGWFLDGRDIRDSAEALRFIKTADEIYVFPITNPLKLRRDDRHLRLLDPEARAKLVSLLGEQRNWFCGFDNRFWVGEGDMPTSVGFSFRQGKTELVLFFPFGGQAEGAFDGQHTSGSLVGSSELELEKWKRRYAQPELAAK